MTIREAITQVAQEAAFDADKLKYFEDYILRITPGVKLDEPLPRRNGENAQAMDATMLRIFRQIAMPMKETVLTEESKRAMDALADSAALVGAAVVAHDKAAKAARNN